MSEYAPFDQEAHLPPPPWKPDDPALVAWEAGHDHDVRLKCYPEFGCRAIENESDDLRSQNGRLNACLDDIEEATDLLDFRTGVRKPGPIDSGLRDIVARLRTALASQQKP